MMIRTNMVKMSGALFRRFSFHSALNSTEWFFLTIIARKKGAIINTVSMPVMAFAHQCKSHPGSTFRAKGRKNVNINAMVAVDRME